MDTLPAAQVVEALIHEYEKLVFHTIYGLTGDWEESQDLTQDTFHQALRGIDAARAASGPNFHAKAWLLRIAVNTVRMQHRRRTIFRFIPFSHMQEDKREQARDHDEHVAETMNMQAAPVQPVGFGNAEPDDPAEIIAEQDMVQRTMMRLPEDFRVCLLLSIVGGLSSAEIAQLLKIKEATVRQRLARARKQFQQLYTSESGETLFDNSATRHTDTMARSSNQDSSEQQTLPNKPQRFMLIAHP